MSLPCGVAWPLVCPMVARVEAGGIVREYRNPIDGPGASNALQSGTCEQGGLSQEQKVISMHIRGADKAPEAPQVWTSSAGCS